ncbi:MAG TPA: NEW3 domain-containing protein, partial [Chitinophagaceae bacterium]|nr:NEW3 domain-containing protein [Chitinophagaceae bacterium]
MQKSSTFSKNLFLLFSLGILFLFPTQTTAKAVALYTPYTNITVSPGQKIDYSIKLINNTSSIKDVRISLYGLPDGWDYTLKSGSWEIDRLAVRANESKTISLEVTVPLKIEKGAYRFHIRASGYDDLGLTVNVSKSGSYESAFTIKQANLEGAANTDYTFNATLKNATADTAFYAFRAHAPRGWQVNFKANYKRVSSVKINPNASQNMTIEVHPPSQAPKGTYKIPIFASSTNTSAESEISVSITGSYDISLSTPSGRLSTDITAGDSKKLTLAIKNT